MVLRNWTIAGSLTLVTLASTLAYYREFARGAGPGNGPVLAEVVRHEGAVRRKKPASFTWWNAVDGELFHDQETLLTGDNGVATLKLRNGTEAAIEPMTLIKMDSGSEDGFLLFAGAVRVGKNHARSRIDPTAGVGEQADPDQKEKNGRFIPRHGERFFTETDRKKSIELSWKIRSPASFTMTSEVLVRAWKIERPAKRIEILRRPVGSPSSLRLDLGPGNYQWAVDAKPPMPSLGFTVVNVTPIAILPERITPNATGAQAVFTWKIPTDLPAREEAEHELVIKQPDRVLKIAIEISEGNKTVSLPSGDYTWSIRSRYPGLELSSTERKGSVKARSETAPTALARSGSGSAERARAEPAPTVDAARGLASTQEETPIASPGGPAPGDVATLPESFAKDNNTLSHRIPLEGIEMGAKLRLQWLYPALASSLVTGWKIVRIQARTSKPEILANVAESRRMHELDLAALSEGDVFKVIALGTPDLESQYFMYSTLPPAPPEIPDFYINLQYKINTTKTDRISFSIASPGQPDRFVLRVFQRDALLLERSFPGSSRFAVLNTIFRTDPKVVVTLHAENGNGENIRRSAETRREFCLGDQNGDRVLDDRDLQIVTSYFFKSIDRKFPYFGQACAPSVPADVNCIDDINQAPWHRVNGDDFDQVKRFLGMSCD